MSNASNLPSLFLNNNLLPPLAQPQGEEKELLVRPYAGDVNHLPENNRYYRVLPRQEYDFSNKSDKIALQRAITRLKQDYPRDYATYMELSGLDVNYSTPEEIRVHFIRKLDMGCCVGTANSLFHHMMHGNCNSLEESARLLQREDVFFRQMLDCIMKPKGLLISKESIRRHALSKTAQAATKRFEEDRQDFYTISHKEQKSYNHKHNASMIRLKAQSSNPIFTAMNIFKADPCSALCGACSSKHDLNEYVAEYNQEKERLEKQHEGSLDRIGGDNHFLRFSESASFPVASPEAIYRESLEKMMEQHPEAQNFIGVIQIPQHVIGFQYGPQGYFLYDTLSPETGLYAYPGRETFFEKMSEQVRSDVEQMGGAAGNAPQAILKVQPLI